MSTTRQADPFPNPFLPPGVAAPVRLRETGGYAYSPLGFAVSRRARQVYHLDEMLAQVRRSDGPWDVAVARLLCERMRAAAGGRPVYASEMSTLGLLWEILRHVLDRYCLEEQPDVLERGLAEVEARRGRAVVEQPPAAFVEIFPPQEALDGARSGEEFLAGAVGRQSGRHFVAGELLLLALANSNPAATAYRELFDDSPLERAAPYRALLLGLEDYLDRQPPLAALGLSLPAALRAPILASPHSLAGQLEYILAHWSALLPEALRRRLLLARGLLAEEHAARGPVAPASPLPLVFDPAAAELSGYPEYERFSWDTDWMSNVVLLAKSTPVWLDQLSRRYGRALTRLDEIPDEELNRLARWGFTGLWLIGVWERSPASEKIKRVMGNPEAMSSAYSLYDYTIAEALGGEAALRRLADRARARGIRLASDMVPNHVGLDSRWIVEHPDWFIQLRHPPFPNYRFSGPNLSSHPDVTLLLEDGYWDHRDAAVVFARVDNRSGETRYIYHGNDGTHMPWNDTAQLNYLLPQVRQAVMDTILHVAGLFPIIRFDAAMTLAKKHYQRLWFPRPGEGGAIPTRAEHGLSRQEFDAAMPEEFWRQVVDRVAGEAPDTLLLAEAFWLMEGYFVRTLGMHRVYNSAFMNMLKLEDNAKYRATVGNVLEFSPEVLKRFVNFMNNPDERTAVEQFGKGDKYFGVAAMMATMPGLPMFGHGQIEGFSEKYGMEYRRAYWDEAVDEELVRRHEREIFPLLRRRRLFSGVAHFAFYDFVAPEGDVNQNVFAYSNRAGEERALFLYNNAYPRARGAIRRSLAMNVGRAEDAVLVRRQLAEALDLSTGPGVHYVFREHRSGLSYLRSGRELAEHGLELELDGYQYAVFLDWRAVRDEDGTWSELAGRLAGRGVPDMARAHKEVVLDPVLGAFRRLFAPERIARLAELLDASASPAPAPPAEGEEALLVRQPLVELFYMARQNGLALADVDAVEPAVRAHLECLADFPAQLGRLRLKREDRRRLEALWEGGADGSAPRRASVRRFAATWSLIHHLGRVFGASRGGARPAEWMRDWLLSPLLAQAFVEQGCDWAEARARVALLEAMADYPEPDASALRRALLDPELAELLGVNEYQGVSWFNRERYEELLDWLLFGFTMEVLSRQDLKHRERRAHIVAACASVAAGSAAAERAGYRLEKTRQRLTPASPRRSPRGSART